MQTIKPKNGHVVIKPYEKPEAVDGLLLAGDQANSAPVRGTVIASSSKEYQVGAELYFRKYAIDELVYTDENGVEVKVFILDEREILAELISDNSNDHANEKTKNKRSETRELSKEHEGKDQE